MRRFIRIGVTALASSMLAACAAFQSPGASATPSPTATASGSSSPTPSVSPSPTPTATPLTTVAVYFLRDGKIVVAHRQVARGDAVGALAALMQGPTAGERSLGLSSAIPNGTQLVFVSWDGSNATVNLSHEYGTAGGTVSTEARLAQVVFTVTQFAPIKYVSFELDGKPVTVFGSAGIVLDHPVTRATYEQLSPVILIESPAIGDVVTSPITVTGTANTYEAVFQIQVIDAGGHAILTQRVQATSGTGTRGTFSSAITLPADLHGAATLRAFEYSPKDGSPINTVEVPITVS